MKQLHASAHISSFELVAVCFRLQELSFTSISIFSIHGNEHVGISSRAFHVARKHVDFVLTNWKHNWARICIWLVYSIMNALSAGLEGAKLTTSDWLLRFWGVIVYSVPTEGTHKASLFPLIFRTSLADNAKNGARRQGEISAVSLLTVGQTTRYAL